MPATYQLTTEFFAIPYREASYLLYSPLKQLLLLANSAMVDLVVSLQDGTFTGVTGANIDAMQLLLESGAVNGAPDKPPHHKQSGAWKPTEVTLFLTNACNLRCSYCYASAGEYKGSLEAATGVAAVELIVRNALELGQKQIRLSFHGGGEPTLAWDALTTTVLRAEELTQQHELEVSLNLASNGVLPAWKVDWLVRHIHEYSISWDGPSWVQDRHRPTVTGRGSGESVEATLLHLESHGAKYGVRLTVTEESVEHLADIIAYLLQRFTPATVHLEPLFSHGRAKDRGLGAPHARAFIENFRQGQKIADQYGIELYYSGARADTITDTFCGVPEGSFNVTPEGLLTSCFEVCHPEDELADQFFYGGQSKTGEFSIDAEKLRRLADHTVRERPECENCFCKWHCAGDCIAKNLTSDHRPGEQLKAARCIINQELTRDQLLRRLRQHSRIMTQVEASQLSEDELLVPLTSAEEMERSCVAAARRTIELPLVEVGGGCHAH